MCRWMTSRWKSWRLLSAPNWNNFLAKIKGLSPEKGGAKGVQLAQNKLQGFTHHLEGVLDGAKGGLTVQGIDAKVAGFAGRPDLILRDAFGNLFQKEYKNLGRGATVTGESVDQLAANVAAAVERAQAGGGTAQQIASRIGDELSRIEYVFRESESFYHPNLRKDMLDLIQLDLEPGLKQLAANVKIPFQRRSVPF